MFVECASAVVAAMDDDLANMETALTARDLNPNARIVARPYDQDLADLAQRRFGIDACHSVSALATLAFVAAALGDGVLSTLERGQRLWLLAQLNVQRVWGAESPSELSGDPPRPATISRRPCSSASSTPASDTSSTSPLHPTATAPLT